MNIIPHFSSLQMEKLCEEMRTLLNATVLDVKGSKNTFVIVLQKENTHKNLFFCFEKPLVRFHLIQQKHVLGKDELLLKKSLLGAILKSIKTLNHDRILEIRFQLNKQNLFFIGEFFSKYPNYHLINEKKEILLSLYPTSRTHYSLPESSLLQKESKTPLLSNHEIEKQYQNITANLLFENEIKELSKQLEKILKKNEKKQKEVQVALQEAGNWQKIQHEGDLLKSNFPLLKRGLDKLVVYDWNQEKEILLSLDPLLLPQEQISQRYKKSKKLLKGISNLERQQQHISETIQLVQDAFQTLADVKTVEEIEELKKIWIKSSKTPLEPQKKEKGPLKPYYEYVSEAGLKIWVGKKAKDNDILTFNLSHGSDWWLHVKDFSGSHVIIKIKKNCDPDSESIQDALQLALEHSQAKKFKEAEITVTQRKFVSRFGKNQPGKVTISKHKDYWIKADPDRIQRLKNRV